MPPDTHKHMHTHTSQRWDGCRRGDRSASIIGAVCVMVAMCWPISSTITHTHTAPTPWIPPRYRTLLKTLATNALMPSCRRGFWLELWRQTHRNAGLCLLSVWGRAPASDSSMMVQQPSSVLLKHVTDAINTARLLTCLSFLSWSHLLSFSINFHDTLKSRIFLTSHH